VASKPDGGCGGWSKFSRGEKRDGHLALQKKIEAVELFPGLPDCYWFKIPKLEQTYQIIMKNTKWPQNMPNGRKIHHKVDHHLPSKTAQKFPIVGFLV
jgi:hypothetical protein